MMVPLSFGLLLFAGVPIALVLAITAMISLVMMAVAHALMGV